MCGIDPVRQQTGLRRPLWKPLCYAQIGGLTVATFITLLLVPVFYSIFVLDLKWINGKRQRTDRRPMRQNQQQRSEWVGGYVLRAVSEAGAICRRGR
jgi:hypothetical protein